MSIPAGAAAVIALPRTNIVLSTTDRNTTVSIFGFRYGGISRINDEGVPFNSVLVSIPDAINVITTLNTINAQSITAEAAVCLNPTA